MNEEPIRYLIATGRKRWLTLVLSHATMRAAMAAAGVLFVALLAIAAAGHHPRTVVAISLAAVGLGLFALVRPFYHMRHRPSDVRVARFIEERVPSLEDRLASAVELLSTADTDRTPFAAPMLADAARRAEGVDADAIIPSTVLRRRGIEAAAAVGLLLVVLVAGRGPLRQGTDAVALALFPEHVTLDVTPGNARVISGTSLAVAVRLVGSRALVAPQLQIGDGERWRTVPMTRSGAIGYKASVDAVTGAFKYRVVAGPLVSATYDVRVVQPPRIARIDVAYTYPADLGLPPRTEEDTGDVYAPAGTTVTLRVHADRPIASGQLALAHGQALALSRTEPAVLTGTLKITDDDSYRVALADMEGLKSAGDTEYYIRTLTDRPPDVHIVKPAADRMVTKLEEVEVEAQAEDDYGIERMELVYSIRGGPDRVIPLPIQARAASVSAKHLFYLENFDVQPGDMITYYVRAHDITRGHRSNEARSDIFFLEVRPFEQEFTLAESQSMSGSGYTGSIDDLINAQKQVVVGTWKLDRRTELAKGASPERDIRTLSRTESDLKSRVEETASSFRESTMRDPRKRSRSRNGQADGIKAGETMPEEDAMTAAAAAMGRAVGSLDALKTHAALPPEMEALNHLLKAQADVKRRQVARQQSGAGAAGNNNRNYDISTLFDQELKRSQQTNYETPTSTERQNPQSETLDRVKELAKRQDELTKRQQDLAKQRQKMTAEEVRRELDKLTREQLDLRRQAEDLAREMAKSGEQPDESGQKNGSSPKPSAGRAAGDRMRAASEEMQNAASDLRREDAAQASARASRALDKLRDAEKQLQPSPRGPDEQHRALGDAELESRQLADAERQIASELKATPRGDASKDAMRRLAGQQDQLADRTRRLQDALKRQGSSGGGEAQGREKASASGGAADAAREAERQRLADRMQRSADAMRAAAGIGSSAEPNGGSKQASGSGGGQSSGGQSGSRAGSQSSAGASSESGAGSQSSGAPSQASGGSQASPNQASAGASGAAAAAASQSGAVPNAGSAEQEIAKALDKLAETIASANAPKDAQSRRLSEQLARAQELKDKLAELSREMEKMARPGSGSGSQAGGQQPGAMSGGQKPGGQQGNGQAGGQASGGQSGGGGQSGKGTEGGSSGQGGSGGQSGPSGQSGSGSQPGGAPSPAQLRDEYARRLSEAQQLADQMRREEQSGHGGGSGKTFEDPGSMTWSAPGTEAFKQDFAKWEQLRLQTLAALESGETVVSKRLEAQTAKDRLAAGADDKAPPAYQSAVDSYFKALANGKK